MVKMNGEEAFTSGNHEDQFKDEGISAYARPDLQQGLLDDKVRTDFYQDAIVSNPALFAGKTVLEVGCGIGIMSMFAARAGASKVIGVEPSLVADQAVQIVKDNGLDGVVTIVKGKIDDIEQLPGVEKVDVIISEIMGVGLIHETAMKSLVSARNRFLKPDGVMFPDKNNMYICGVEAKKLHERHIGFWDDVYGFDMTELGKHAKSYAWHVPLKPKHVVTEPCLLKEYDWSKLTEADFFFSTPFTIKSTKKESIHSLALYFDIHSKGSSLSTGPEAACTHWGQLAFHLEEPLQVEEGEEVSGTFCVKPYGERDLEFSFKIDFKGKSIANSYIHYCPVSSNGAHLMYCADD